MIYDRLGPCCHLYTAEGFGTIFLTDEDFKAGMRPLSVIAGVPTVFSSIQTLYCFAPKAERN